METEDAWRLMLQHAWQPAEQEVVCKLLCVSQHMRTLVHSTCVGRLSIRVLGHDDQASTSVQLPRKRAKQLEWWLSKHQQLVCALVLQSHLLLEGPHHASSITAVEPGRQKPSQSSSALRQRWSWCRQLLTTPLPRLSGLLQPGQFTLSTPLTHLTRLEWAVSSSSKCETFIKSLKQLPDLRVLALTCIDSGTGPAALESLAPALQSLSTLTALQLQHFAVSTPSSSMLPPSLHVLTLGPPLPRLFQRATRDQHLHLQHLTQLQHLQLHTLKACDLLPAQLTSLDVHLCSVRPLLRLQHLQQLSITGQVPESVLDQLRELTQLQQLQLGPCSTAALSPGGLACLQQLPVSRLEAVQQLPALGVLPTLQLQLESWEGGSSTSISTSATGSFSTSSRAGSSTSGSSCSISSSASSSGSNSSSSTCLLDQLEELLQRPTPQQDLPVVSCMESVVLHKQELQMHLQLQQGEEQQAQEAGLELHSGSAAGVVNADVTPSQWPVPEVDSDKVCSTCVTNAACVSIVVHSE
jgi:hypothetical protein